ncbi:M13-type metalloendopeptidase [Aquimonas voraii]|uniref:Putative endopeptidase n=1 Tax=Aquimonas voraii TaxID=265719 RepID=A0A1G6SVI2_9GAMM|nr:M13 family metallopeptidase [Aquimonas voraii]SDD20872.1 putative endopeptidase [Aquimonas voraii]
MLRSPARLLSTVAFVLCALPLAHADSALDARHRDAATAACMDFYQHANGGWLAATPVPAGQASIGYTDELRVLRAEQQRDLLKGFANAPANALDGSIARLYALGMDTAAIDALGLGPAARFLQRIDGLEKPRELPALLGELHAWGAPILFAFSVAPDLDRPERLIAYANQGGLGLPDRDYYLREDAPALELREAYRAYVERLLGLAGRVDAAAESQRVLAMEADLASASLSLEQLRDPRNSYRLTRVRDLERAQPELRWRDYLKAQGLRKLDDISLAHASFFSALNSRFTTQPLSDWQAYLRFHVLHAAAPYLGQPFVEAHDRLFTETLGGQATPSREARVLNFLQTSLGEALGQRYARAHFDAPRREAVLALAEGLRAQLRALVEGATWLQAEGRQALLADIDRLSFALGGPTETEWEGFELQAQNWPEAVLAVSRARHQRALAALGEAPRRAWPVSASSLQVSYQAATHTLYVPAAVLQSPLFEPAGDVALNHGVAGVLIARGLMGVFDPASGARRGLLSDGDRAAYAERSRGLVGQYSTFTALGNLKVDGAATWNENVLDLGALQLAYTAFLAAGGEEGESRDGLTPAQRFFHAWARLMRRNYQDEALRLLLVADTRAPARFRVNGPLPHLPSFQAAFSCKDGQTLYLPEPARARTF